MVHNELEHHIKFLKKLPISSDLGKKGKCDWISYAIQPDNIVHSYHPYDNHDLLLTILYPVFPEFMRDVAILLKEEESVYKITKLRMIGLNILAIGQRILL